jgi:hypothetical protein
MKAAAIAAAPAPSTIPTPAPRDDEFQRRKAEIQRQIDELQAALAIETPNGHESAVYSKPTLVPQGTGGGS